MEDHVRYLAEEVAYDHADGLISRRDALRQLGRLGFGAVAASALLAACGSGNDADDVPTLQTAPAPSGFQPGRAVATEAITYPDRPGTLQGALATATTAKGAVLVIHENRGLTDHIRSVAGRLAAAAPFSARFARESISRGRRPRCSACTRRGTPV